MQPGRGKAKPQIERVDARESSLLDDELTASALETAIFDIRGSFEVALAAAGVDHDTIRSVLVTVDDAVGNHFDELLARFPGPRPETGTAIVVAGNPVDGLVFYGPFASIEEAINWAEIDDATRRRDWWTATLNWPVVTRSA